MKTRITDLLGIRYPVFQGAMAHITDGRFAAAVSEAGALGVISGSGKTPEYIREQIRVARAFTMNPFAVNIIARQEMGVADMITILIEEKVKNVILSAGNPVPWISLLKDNSICAMCVVAAPRQAIKAEQAGADVVIAEGSESGGHIGSVHTLPLVAAVTEEVAIPVVAAGGFADGRGLAAAMALGADGIQMGTAFLTTEECPVSPLFKELILQAEVGDTVVTGRTMNDVVRAVRSPLSDRLEKLEKQFGNELVMKEIAAGSLQKAVHGNWEEGSFQAGQSAGLIRSIVPCRVLVENVVEEAKITLKKLKIAENT